MELNELSTEIELIRSVAQLYVDGVKYAEISKIEKAFHSDWNMTGFYEDGEYRHFDYMEFLQLIEQKSKNAESFPRFGGGIVDIQFHGKTAIVKIHLENEQVVFTDHLSLLKISGEWKIIHKIWDTETKSG